MPPLLPFAARALPRAFGAGLDAADLAALLRRAHAEVGARLVLACAREGLVDADLHDMSLRAGPFALPLRRRRAFGLHAAALEAVDLPPPLELLRRLTPRLAPATAARLADELTCSAEGLALAAAAAALRERALAAGRAWPAPLDPENLVVVGHPWHPSCKARLGMRRWELVRHAPELLAQAPVAAVDVRADRAALSGPFAELTGPLFPPAPAGWVRLPVHALQRRRLPRLLGPAWGTEVRPVAAPPLPARALLSLRTVSLAHHPLHLKLAVDVHTTSARRQVSPQSVVGGPRLSALLAEIAAADPLTRRGLQVWPDAAAAGLAADAGPLAGQIGVIVRPAPGALVAGIDLSFSPGLSGQDPEILVCAALGERRPGAGPLLHGLSAGYPGDRRARLAAFARDYVALLVPPLLRLLTAHGVALEAHLQNTLLVHAGRPRGFLIRDLGGIRVHRPRLRRSGRDVELPPGAFTITDDLAEAQGKLMHTLVHAHLAALFGWIEDAGGPPCEELWPLARAALAAALDAWRREPALTRACDEDRAFFFAPTCRAKALWTMRVDQRSSDYAYITVDNVLAAPA